MIEVYLRLAAIFFKIGLFTVGGGYAMLPLIQEETTHYGWLTIGEFADIIAISEMTPGPIAVNTATFVGYRVGGVLGSVVATIAVALPSLLIVVLISKFLSRFSSSPVTEWVFKYLRPAVVGLIASAALFLGQSTLFPGWDIDFRATLITVVVGFGLFKFKLHPIWALLGAGLMGLVLF
ncbi:MAG: chromate transporter [Limnochordia bacterium]|jgi:chromate transporter|nr:chromate transporter [Limnochordia bacterium]MDD2629217.1 chromate transporter [Limnochordia bacterium]MDD4517652.1 chromate transporter [Limnochordia bacterium]